MLKPSIFKQMKGAINVCGKGGLLWNIEDVTRGFVITESYYVPSANIRLFSP